MVYSRVYVEFSNMESLVNTYWGSLLDHTVRKIQIAII